MFDVRVAAGAVCALATAVAAPAFAANAARGAQVFRGTCAVCHIAEPHPALSDLATRIGPNLWGVVGRKAGTSPHFRYSVAMLQSGVVWTPQNLRTYIHEPQKTIPEVRMSFPGLRDMRDVEDVIAYLETFK